MFFSIDGNALFAELGASFGPGALPRSQLRGGGREAMPRASPRKRCGGGRPTWQARAAPPGSAGAFLGFVVTRAAPRSPVISLCVSRR